MEQNSLIDNQNSIAEMAMLAPFQNFQAFLGIVDFFPGVEVLHRQLLHQN